MSPPFKPNMLGQATLSYSQPPQGNAYSPGPATPYTPSGNTGTGNPIGAGNPGSNVAPVTAPGGTRQVNPGGAIPPGYNPTFEDWMLRGGRPPATGGGAPAGPANYAPPTTGASPGGSPGTPPGGAPPGYTPSFEDWMLRGGRPAQQNGGAMTGGGALMDDPTPGPAPEDMAMNPMAQQVQMAGKPMTGGSSPPMAPPELIDPTGGRSPGGMPGGPPELIDPTGGRAPQMGPMQTGGGSPMGPQTGGGSPFQPPMQGGPPMTGGGSPFEMPSQNLPMQAMGLPRSKKRGPRLADFLNNG